MWCLPVCLDHIIVLNCGLLTHVIVDTGLVTCGMPSLIQIVIPLFHRKICGLGGETAADAECSPVINGSACASAWSLSPPGTTCSQECDPCSGWNSTSAAAFSSQIMRNAASQTMEGWGVLWVLCRNEFLDFIFKEVQILQLLKIFSEKRNCKLV